MSRGPKPEQCLPTPNTLVASGPNKYFNGIDCPEKGQAYGTKTKQAISELVFNKEVILQTRGKDKYRRTIADVLLPDGTNVNQQLVKQG